MPSSDAVRVLFGRVIDEKTHRPLGGATVELVGTSGVAAATDEGGLFVLPVAEGAASLDLRVTFGGTEVARQTAMTAAPLLLTVPASTASRPAELTVAETASPTISTAKQYWLSRLIADARIAHAAGRATTIAPELLGGDECQCDTCLSAVSPVAYLADLIAYLVSAVTNGGAAISLSWLQDAFCQQFGELLLDCEDVDRQVHQVRICIEVLRCSLDVAQPVPGEDLYRLHAYREILQRQGTSVDEVRLAPHADDDSRSSLAQRLGIVTGSRPDRLDALALGSAALTEEALETLFGLGDTRRNPLSGGVTRNDAADQIRRWNVEHIAWGRNTDRDGIGYVAITYDGKYGTFSLYRDAARTQLVASGTAAATVVGLSPQNGGLLTGRIELQSWSATATIELQLIPKLVAWRLDQLRRLWADADRPTNVFVDFADDLPANARRPIIDPDLIGVDDFRYPYLPATGAPDNAFDIWSRRREFIDAQLHELALMTKTVPSPGGAVTVPDFNLLLARNFKPVQYETQPAVDVWKAPLTVADLDRTARELGRPDTAAAATARVTNGFLLSLPAFARLMELRQRDRQGDTLAADEWDEVFSILVQAQKQALNDTFIAEETAAGIDLGPKNQDIAKQKTGAVRADYQVDLDVTGIPQGPTIVTRRGLPEYPIQGHIAPQRIIQVKPLRK